MSQRPGIPYRTVFAWLGLSLALAFALSVYVYHRYVRYVPHVFSHVPENFAVALHLDVEQAVVYEPFRRHLLPLLDGSSRSRIEALRSATTIEFGVDLREVAIVVDDAGKWLVLLGGHFRRDGVAEGAAEVLEREGILTRTERDPERLVHPSGAAFAVAGDGVVLLAASEDLLLRALAVGTRPSPFRSGAALSVVIGAGEASPLDGARLDVWPGQEFPVEFRLLENGGRLRAEDIGPLVSGKTGDFKLLTQALPWQTEAEAPGTFRATTVLSRAEFDALVAEVARGLAVLVGLDPPSPSPLGDSPPGDSSL